MLIAGVGDLLRRDDGFGPSVIRALERINLPENVVIRDYGTRGFDLIFDLQEFDEVIFLDAMDFDGKPGEIKVIEARPKRISDEEMVRSINLSLHEIDLEKVIDIASSLNILPKGVTIIGCKPKDLSFGIGLSEEVKSSVNLAVKVILEKLRRELEVNVRQYLFL